MALPLLSNFSLMLTQWKSALDPVIATAIVSGNAVNSVSISTSAKSISHGLNRQPQGWFLIDNSANSVVWRTAWDTNTITLQASAAATISIWVF